MKNLPTATDMTALMQAAISTHEIFTSYVQAGFARDEALQIVIALITAGVAGGTKGDQP